MDGNGKIGRPLESHHGSVLRYDEVLAILNADQTDQCSQGDTVVPKGGDVYICKLQQPDATEQSSLLDDGLNWTTTGSASLPSNRRTVVSKKSCCVVDKNGSMLRNLQKDIYQKEAHPSGQPCVIVHYIGNFQSFISQMKDNTINEQAADTTSMDVDPSDDTEQGAVSSQGYQGQGSSPGPSMAPDSSSDQPDLESAMAVMKAALAAKRKNSPAVMDMFHKLMESVTEDGSDMDMCLVVSDRKSGHSSVIGTPDLVSAQSTGRSKRKRTSQLFEDSSVSGNEGNEDDSNTSSTDHKRVPQDGEVLDWKGDIVTFPALTKENCFSFNVISDEEKQIHADFFDKRRRSTKSADRYLRIRNHIIHMWQKQKPQFVSKSHARKGLTDCGDVTCISRIHTYLTCKGVINFKAVKHHSAPKIQKKAKRRKIVEDTFTDEEDEEEQHHESVSLDKEEPTICGKASTTNTSKRKPMESESETSKSTPKKHQPAAKNLHSALKKLPESNKKGTEKLSVEVTPVSVSGRSRRNVSTPNWADIISGRKSFRDGAVLRKDGEISDEEEVEKDDIAEETELAAASIAKTKKKQQRKLKSKPEDNRTKIDDPEVDTEIPKEHDDKESKECNEKEIKHDKTTESVKETENNDKEVDGAQSENEEIQHVTYVVKQQKKAKVVPLTVMKGTYQCSICSKAFSSKTLLDQHINFLHILSEKGKKIENEDGDEDDDFADDIVEIKISDFEAKANNDSDSQDEDFNEIEQNADDINDADTDIKREVRKEIRNEIKAARIEKIRSFGQLPSKRNANSGSVKCEKCGTKFAALANLKRHMLLHTDKVYECPYCAKIMKRMDYVVAHVRKVHKEVDLEENPIDFEKYSHTVPEERDSDRPNMQSDQEDGKRDKMKVITGTGKKVCPECSKLFDTQEELEQHMVQVHDKELKDAAYTCQACKKTFTSLVSFQVHKLTHRKKDFVCPHCDKKFTSNTQLQIHKRNDHEIQYGALNYFGYLMNNGRITCEICSANFDGVDEYLIHRHEHLTFEYLCAKCGNGFNDREMFEKHRQNNCEGEEFHHFPCGVCNKRFGMYDARRKHVMTFHPKKSDYFCHHCGKEFDNADLLAKHFESHQLERVYICETCDKTFFEKRNLIDHRDVHKSSKNFQCKICLKFYLSYKSLQRHIKLHLANATKACKYCDGKFANVDDLNKHMQDEHSVALEVEEFACPKCPRTYSSQVKLEKHYVLHELDGGDSTKYMCTHCEQIFDSVEMPLELHMEQEHPNIGREHFSKKTWKCSECDFTTPHKQRIERHMETHNAEKKFECKYCGKRYQTTSTLMTHIISHRGKVRRNAKPQPICVWPDCGKQFMKHSLYKRHLISHLYKVKSGKELCRCGQCAYSGMGGKKFNMVFPPGKGESVNIQAIGFVDDMGQTHVTQHMNKILTAHGGSMVEVNVKQGMEPYQSMEVLQEAIAKIEDIERHTETNMEEEQIDLQPTKPTEEVTEGADLFPEDPEASTSGVGTPFSTAVQMPANSSVIMAGSGAEGNGADSDASMSTDGQKILYVNNTSTKELQIMEMPQSGAFDSDLMSTANTTGGEHVIIEGSDGRQTIVNILNMPLNQDGQGVSSQTTETEGVLQSHYECGVCELIFQHACHALYHLESMHEEQSFPKCDLCGKLVLDQKNLMDHRLIHNEDKKYDCKDCGRKFKTKQCLRQHSYVHVKNKPFNCDYCGHGFTQKGFYEEHLRRHMGLKPFKCGVCAKQFVSKSLLKIHLYSHTTNKPHKCPYCPKTFSENYLLQTHVRNHEDNRPYQCTECMKAFCAKAKLVRHLNTVHGIDKEELVTFVPTRIGGGLGYRDPKKHPEIKPRTTQVVYIDSQGHIVRKEMREVQHDTIGGKDDSDSSSQPSSMSDMQMEVLTQRDADGNIHTIVPTQFIADNMMAMGQDGMPIVYQEVEGNMTGEGSIQFNGQSYTLVTKGDLGEEVQKLLIAQGLEGVQVSEGEGMEAHLQVVKMEEQEVGQMEEQEVDEMEEQEVGQMEEQEVGQMEEQEVGQMEEGGMEDLEGDNVHVITGSEGLAADGMHKFSINIGEDGSVNESDLEAIKNMYNDQQIIFVVESPQSE